MTIMKIKLSGSRLLICFIALILLFAWSMAAGAGLSESLEHLQQAYPDFIKSVNSQSITWTDDTVMPVHDTKPPKTIQEKLDAPSLADQLEQAPYIPGMPADVSTYHPAADPGRIRYEPFFRKMYGNTAAEVESRLTTVYWMPKLFGKHFPLQVTTVNSVDKKIARVSDELEQLVLAHPEYRKYLDNPAGFFYWRQIAETNRLSPHSFGISLDLNTEYSNYWEWDLKKRGLPVSESMPVKYTNQIPWAIVLVFEKYGFIWGGKWYHYDTMHFEYRPELLIH